jgi:omega-amidase
MAWLRQLSADTAAVVTGSWVIRSGDTVYNRLIWMRPDGSFAFYDKRHLFRMAGEHERYGAGTQRLIVELNGWRICPMVCYDLRFPVFSRNHVLDAAAVSTPLGGATVPALDYDALIFVANWPSARAYAWKTLLRARAIENLSYCIGVNRTGTDGNGLHYGGDSVAVDFLGQALVEAGAQPQLLTVTLSRAALLEHRTRFPAYLDADAFALTP